MKLLLIDDDASFRLGLRIWLNNAVEFTIVGEVSTRREAQDFLSRNTVDMIVIELAIGQGLALCQEMRRNYPNLPIFVLTRLQESVFLESALALGVEGYCPKTVDSPTLLAGLRRVATGSTYHWRSVQLSTSLWRMVRNYMRDTGIVQVDLSLVAVSKQLAKPDLSVIESWILAGQKRELKAARWLLEQIWRVEPQTSVVFTSVGNAPILSLWSRLQSNLSIKLEQNFENGTELPLELDILLPIKRKELLYLTKQKVEEQLEQLRFSQVTPEKLIGQRKEILSHLWENVTEAFLGTYTTLKDDRSPEEVSVLPTLLKDREIVETAILDRIPLVAELFSTLLFETPLAIDHASWEVETKEAQIFAEDLFHNLLIQVANAVLQPLINHFAGYEAMKQRYFNTQYRSTREIERFRNELSWKYRYRYFVREPRDIFESKYELLILTRGGIDRMYIYGSRNQELRQLQGWQLLLTLALEFQDALTPRVRSIIDFVGRGVVFVLTEVIGRGIGLIGKGIFRGIGYAWQPDGKIRRP